jgi:hypothetical protein
MPATEEERYERCRREARVCEFADGISGGIKPLRKWTAGTPGSTGMTGRYPKDIRGFFFRSKTLPMMNARANTSHSELART